MASFFDRVRAALAPRYTVERQAGEGGMGVVYEAYDHRLKRRVAVKVLRPETATAVGQERFRREALILAALEHPNLITIHDVDEKDGLSFFTMDYLDGETLAARLRRGPLPLDEVVTYGCALLETLEHVHSHAITHRDLKPSNLFLQNGRIVLGDFGIARSADWTGGPLTTPGQKPGTLLYMAPEQAADGEVGPWTDIYATAMVLYEAAKGKRWVATAHRDPSRGNWDGIPRRLARVLRRALAYDQRQRWPDAAAFRVALEKTTKRSLSPWIWAPVAFVLAVVFRDLAREIRDLWAPPSQRVDCARGNAVDFGVLPFASDNHDDRPGNDLARLVGLKLEWYPQWTMVPVPKSQGWWDTTPPARRQIDAAKALCATRIVTGEIGHEGGKSTLLLTVRDSSGGLRDRIEVRGDDAQLVSWSAAAADSLVARLFPRYLDRYRELSARQGGNLEAYREFFNGEKAFQRDAWVDAEQHFQRALDLDTTFLQAAWRVSVVRRWRRVPFEADLRRLYVAHRAALPDLYRLLIEAQLLPDVRGRLALYDSAVRLYPRDGFAGLLQADELFMRGPLVGISVDSGIAMLWKAAAREAASNAGPALTEATWGNMLLGRQVNADSALKARLRVAAGSTPSEDVDVTAFLRLAYHLRFNPIRGRVVQWWQFRNSDSATVMEVAKVARLAIKFDLPEAQLAFGRMVLRAPPVPQARSSAFETEALALMALGQPLAAFARFDSAADQFATPEAELQAFEWRVVPTSLGLPADSTQRALGIAGLERWARADSTSALGARAIFGLALNAYARGDTLGAQAWEARMPSGSPGAQTKARLQALLAAMREASRNRPVSALALSEPLLAYDSTGLIGGPFARAASRLNRGRWLAELGRSAEADREWLWYENSDLVGWPNREAQAGEVDAVMSVYARLLRGQLALEHGSRAVACGHFQRVAQLWAGSEPALAPLKGEVNARLAHCR